MTFLSQRWGRFKQWKLTLHRVNKFKKNKIKSTLDDRSFHIQTHPSRDHTSIMPSLCCDYTTASPTPNWQALSAGSILETGLGGMCGSWSGAGCEITAAISVERAQKTGSSVLSMESATPPLPLRRSLPPTETSISSPQPDSRSVSLPAHSLHTVSKGWFSRKQTV